MVVRIFLDTVQRSKYLRWIVRLRQERDFWKQVALGVDHAKYTATVPKLVGIDWAEGESACVAAAVSPGGKKSLIGTPVFEHTINATGVMPLAKALALGKMYGMGKKAAVSTLVADPDGAELVAGISDGLVAWYHDVVAGAKAAAEASGKPVVTAIQNLPMSSDATTEKKVHALAKAIHAEFGSKVKVSLLGGLVREVPDLSIIVGSSKDGEGDDHGS